MAFQRTYGLCWLVSGLPRPPPRPPGAPAAWAAAAPAGGGELSAAAAADLNAATCGLECGHLRRKAIHNRLETRIRLQHILAHPRLRTTRAKRRRDEPDGLVNRLLQITRKKVTDARKARHRCGRADLPFAHHRSEEHTSELQSPMYL